MPEKSVEYTCKILPLGNFISIVIAVNISMAIMFLGIYLGIPVFIIVALFVGVMVLLINYLSSFASFTFTSIGLTRSIQSSTFLFRNTEPAQYTWSEVKAYKNGTDKGAYRGEFQYLEIKFRDGKEWKLTDMYGERKVEFSVFLNGFLSNVQLFNQGYQRATPEVLYDTKQTVLLEENGFIERKKTIYETVWGKLITVLLGIFIVVVFIYTRPYMGVTSLFKIFFVLIPGFIYLVYRSFIKKDTGV